MARTPEQNRAHVAAWQKVNKEAYNARMRRWRAANRDTIRAYEKARRAKQNAEDPDKQRQKNRKKTLQRYELTPAQWDMMFEAQSKCCAICKSPDSFGRWHTDHDDAVGLTAVRGVLCVRCNIGLGQFLDSPELLQAAIEYLRSKQ